MVSRTLSLALAAGLFALSACSGGIASGIQLTEEEQAKGIIPVTVTTKSGRHVFKAEPAKTPAEQQRGLMFRTDLTETSAMLFWPYPAEGGGPREASFWMKDTPTALDIIFIRPDGTIARIGRGEPFDESPVASGELVGAVLEVKAGVAAATGMAEGDKVTWPEAK
jgi:uncharacterized protein